MTMQAVLPLASALGLGMLAGLRLYATVFVIGLLIRFFPDVVPVAWQSASVLADSRVLVAAGAGCTFEFIADKVPWVDSAWDSLHTFIRPIGAALLASSLFSNTEPVYQVLLFLLAGGVALSEHAAKASARLAINHSPEPFSNIAVSLAEDAATAGGLYLLVKHPWVMAGVATCFLVLFAWLAPRIWRAVRVEWAALGALLRYWFGEARPPQLTAAQQRWLSEHLPGETQLRLYAVISTTDMKGLRNALGTLCLTGGDAVLFSLRWGRLVARRMGMPLGIETARGLLLDRLVLTTAGGQRTRFDLLAGQLQSAEDKLNRSAPPAPAT